MSASRQKIPPASVVPEKLAVHLVTPDPADTEKLTGILSHRNCNLCWFRSAEEANHSLTDGYPAVVLCERDLPDGSWKSMLERIERMARRPVLLVMSPFADERLWAEVLNLGGYDVLAKPLDEAEVIRVIDMACRNWAASSGAGTTNMKCA